MSELLALHPPAQAELLGLSLSSYTEDLGRGTRLAEAVAALYDDSVTPEDVLILSGVDPVIDTFAALIEPGMRGAADTRMPAAAKRSSGGARLSSGSQRRSVWLERRGDRICRRGGGDISAQPVWLDG